MRFVLLSLNTWGLPFGIARDLPRRTEALGATFATASADVIALQEVWTTRARAHLRSAAAEAGYVHAFFVDRSQANAGLVVFSKWPFERGRASHFRVRGRAERIQHADFWSGKGWLDLTLATPAGRLRLIDTHLHAAYADAGAPDEYASDRLAQTIELAHGLRDRALPLIAVGDFNMHEGSEEYVAWQTFSGTRDAASQLDARQATVLRAHPYSGPGARDQRIDYAFLRDGRALGVRPVSIERSFDQPIEIAGAEGRYSDHAGLRLEVDVHATQAAPDPALPPPPPPRELTDLVRLRLEEASLRTQARARRQTTAGVAGLVAAGAAGFAADLTTRDRRTLLRMLAFTPPALGLIASGSAVALGQAFTASAARQYLEVARLLDDFEDDPTP